MLVRKTCGRWLTAVLLLAAVLAATRGAGAAPAAADDAGAFDYEEDYGEDRAAAEAQLQAATLSSSGKTISSQSAPLERLQRTPHEDIHWRRDADASFWSTSRRRVKSGYDDQDDMQADQPAAPEASFSADFSPYKNFSSGDDDAETDAAYVRTVRNRRDTDLDDRYKDSRLQAIKYIILRETGRENSSLPKTIGTRDVDLSALNISQLIPHFQMNNDSGINDEFLTEKIRSYYPSCEIPRNTDQDVWKDDNTMNLFFNVDHEPDDTGISIATATLRLYRLPKENITVIPVTSSSTPDSTPDVSCENSSGDQEEKLLRISIYWYTKSLKRHRVKRRLSDSKVVSENIKWVELSVRPATRAWTRGRNLGLAVILEDQEGSALKADKYFKGASCTQHQNQSRPLSSMQLEGSVNLNELMAVLEQIQQQPCITTYHCSQR